MFLFSVAMGALLRGRSAINTINIITDFIFWVEEYRSLYRGLQSWYRGSLTGRCVRRHPTSTIVIEFFGVRLLHVTNTVMQEFFFSFQVCFQNISFPFITQHLANSNVLSLQSMFYIHTYIYIYNLFDIAGYKIQATNYSWCGAA